MVEQATTTHTIPLSATARPPSLTVRGTLLRRKSPCLRLAHVERSSLLVARALVTWKRILSTGSIAPPPRSPLRPLVAALCAKGERSYEKKEKKQQCHRQASFRTGAWTRVAWL